MKLLLPLVLISTNLWAHTEELQVIEVGHGREESSLVNFIPAASQLKQKQLLKRREVTLGDTLKNEVGIQSSSFGPNASRPIIRGLEGDRIRVLQNGLGTLDASSQSVDHAIPIDTMTIDRVEVVRGPMALLYGSSAVGGVVNIVNNRIHREFSEGAISQVDARGESVNNGLGGAARLDYGVNNWMLHFDGSYQHQGEQEIPGNALSKRFRSRSGEEGQRDRLRNSENLQTSLAAGASKITKSGHVGFSYYRFDNEYGSVADQDVDIKMVQNRVEFSTEHRTEGSFLKNIRLRSAQSFYKHEEFELSEIGTTFKNNGNETRLEFLTARGAWNGVSGIQTQFSSFKAVGDEAFLPTSRSMMASIFSLQEYHFNQANTLQFGGRVESTKVEKDSTDTFGASDEKGFTGLNGSLGYLKKFSKALSFSASLSYTERAPTFQELYADGAHIATGQYELGDSTLKKEKSHALEFTVKKDKPDSKLTVSAFAQKFQDYVILAPNADVDVDSGFPVLAYSQDRALLYGFEIDSLEEITHSFLGGSWWFITRADLVIGKNESTDDYLPRMPAPRVTLGLEYQRDRWEADFEVQRYFEQTHTNPNELATDAFYLVNAGVMYEIPKDSRNYRLYLRGRNLLDQDARLHTSFLKERAPMPGRNVIAGVQALF